MAGKESGGQSSRTSSTSGGSNACTLCTMSTYNKPSLECCLCTRSTHTNCLPDWKDLNRSIDITKLFSRSGLKWYCQTCEPTLSDYISGDEIKKSLAQIETKMDSVQNLVCENIKLTKSETFKPDNTFTEIKQTVERLETNAQSQLKQKEKEERAHSVIIHGLKENNNTMEVLMV